MQQHKNPLIILTGPTAVGKTDLSVQLAKKINGEIIICWLQCRFISTWI